MERNAREPITVHWSVDFVEHLRTVHFALVALSATLLVLVMGARDQKIAKALTQATLISALVENWSDIPKGLYVEASNRLRLPAPDTPYLIKAPVSSEDETGVTLEVIVPEAEIFKHKYMPGNFSEPMNFIPRTLADFASWWDKLHAGIDVSIPDFSKKPTSCYALVEPKEKAHDEQTLTLDDYYKCKMLDDAEAKFRAFSPVRAQLDVSDVLSEPSISAVQEINPLEYKAKPMVLHLWMTIPSGKATVNERSLEEFFPAWGSGAFKAAFPELYEVSASLQLNNIPVKGIASRVAELQPKGEQALEALGLKIPAVEVTRWGLFLLLATQSYFWLHLHEFNRKVAPDSPGREVAWIGVYRSRPARCATLVSSCVVPLATLVVLAMRLPSDLPTTWTRYVTWTLTAIVLLIGGALAIGTGERLWRLHAIFPDELPSKSPPDNQAQ